MLQVIYTKGKKAGESESGVNISLLDDIEYNELCDINNLKEGKLYTVLNRIVRKQEMTATQLEEAKNELSIHHDMRTENAQRIATLEPELIQEQNRQETLVQKCTPLTTKLKTMGNSITSPTGNSRYYIRTCCF